MGVRGLTTFIAENSGKYLIPHELSDCLLVIDGNNISSCLYKLSKSHSAFGGDYDEYYQIVSNFFTLLKKCNITPIVLFDGGYDAKKLRVCLQRFAEKITILESFVKGFSTESFFPLMLKQTFVDVLMDMNIFCIQCELEADVEIAAVARSLECPVLSHDSDFYVLNVLYISFYTMNLKPIKCDDSDRCFIKCLLFDTTHFLNKFPCLDVSLLPMLGVLLGNDYVEASLATNFVRNIQIEKNKGRSFTQNKIYGVINFLQGENFESALDFIRSHLKNRKYVKILKNIKSGMRNCKSTDVSESVFEILQSQFGVTDLNVKPSLIHLPDKIKKLFSLCRINKSIIDMILLNKYFTYLQIEDIYFQSSHLPSLELIREIYFLLKPYLKKTKPLNLYLIKNNSYNVITVEDDSSFLNNTCLNDVLNMPNKKRLKLLCDIVGIDISDLDVVTTSDWSIFLMSFIYWVKKLKSTVTLAHIHAIVLMAIANQIVQKSVGYFRNSSNFMKSKGKLLKKLKNTKFKVSESTSFSEMLRSVPLIEKLLIQHVLIPFRQTSEKGMSKAYKISIVHLFNTFQSCFFHIMQLNALLNYPLPYCNVSNFYSGTLLLNFYLNIRSKGPVEGFGCNLFKETPNLAKLYTYLYANFCKYSDGSFQRNFVKTSTHKKRRKKKSRR